MSAQGEGGNGGEQPSPSPTGGGGGGGDGGGGGGGGLSRTTAAAAAITGFLICFILLLVVVALIAYNIYLWRKRKNEGRAARQRLVRQPSPSWKAYQEANGIGGGPSLDRLRRGRDNLGYAYSSGSVDIKGSGPPPTATLDDINLSDEEEDGNNGNKELRVRYTKGNTKTRNSPYGGNDQYEQSDRLNGQNGYWDTNTGERVRIYTNTQSYPNPAIDDPEIQLRPASLETSLKQIHPSNSPGKQSLENHYIYSNNNNTGGPPPAYNSFPEGKPVSKPPRPTIQGNRGLALLSPATGKPMVPRTVSLTGMGALECPGVDFGPTTVSHSGNLGYNDY